MSARVRLEMAFVAALLLGCSDPANVRHDGTGGRGAAAGDGGTVSSGGTLGSGGTSSSGGAAGGNGGIGAGGTVGSGGAVSSGGTSASGGAAGVGGARGSGGAAGSRGSGSGGSGGATLPEPAVNFKGFNWADQRDNFVTGVLYVSGLTSSSTGAQAQALAAMVFQTWQGVGANTVRLPINPQTVSSPFWSVYKNVIDTGTSMGFKVILCPWTSNHTQKIEDMNQYWAMWDAVTADYGKNSMVYFELMNEVSYDASAWRTICLQYLTRYSTLPKGRVIIPGCGKNGERNSNQMGAFHDFDDCLLAVHLYNPWDGTSGDPTWWYNQAASEIQPYGARTIVTEYGQTMATKLDYMGSPTQDPVVAYLTGLSMYMRDNKMGGTHWVGLRDGDSWSLFKRNGTDSLTVTNMSGLARIKYSWGL